MRNIFADTRELDKAAREKYSLSEEIMMENAAAVLERAVEGFMKDNPRIPITILCGSGNNGADGYALARRIIGKLDVTVAVVEKPYSDLCKSQAEMARLAGVPMKDSDLLDFPDGEYAGIIVDCIFGSGFHGRLDQRIAALLDKVNSTRCSRIACDVPTGLDRDGNCDRSAFRAGMTVSMGALTSALYSDWAKDHIGLVICGELGVSQQLYESASEEIKPVAKLLEVRDMRTPRRMMKNVNKGTFGHVVIASGERLGASCIAGSAALRFGAGLVTLVRDSDGFSREDLPRVPAELMTSSSMPEKTSAVAFGMGLGRGHEFTAAWFDWLCDNPSVPCVVDADAFYDPELRDFLYERGDGVVLTPHAREMQSLLSICELGEYTVPECVGRRMELVETFCRAFPGTVLLAKGVNSVIGKFDGEDMKLFINPLGRPNLAKAGTGDVLAGMVCALLAQGFHPLDSAIIGSLGHAIASRKANVKDYALTPFSLIHAIEAE